MPDRDWMTTAACRNEDPRLFFPDQQGPAQQKTVDRAQAVCRNCPVKTACAAYCEDTGSTFGVWGGVFVRKPVSATGIPPTDFPHGTEAGYKRHGRRQEPACRACRDAASRNSFERQRRRDRGAA